MRSGHSLCSCSFSSADLRAGRPDRFSPHPTTQIYGQIQYRPLPFPLLRGTFPTRSIAAVPNARQIPNHRGSASERDGTISMCSSTSNLNPHRVGRPSANLQRQAGHPTKSGTPSSRCRRKTSITVRIAANADLIPLPVSGFSRSSQAWSRSRHRSGLATLRFSPSTAS